MNETLANEPLLKNRPWSNVLASPPELFFAKVIIGSSIVNVVESIVVVDPFTVKLPVIVAFPEAVNVVKAPVDAAAAPIAVPVSYTHLRAHET